MGSTRALACRVWRPRRTHSRACCDFINLELLDEAVGAGAAFVVTPTVEPKVIAECVNHKLPVFPGAFSPTEVVRAWDLGAMMVKVFPAESVGPNHIRPLKAPLPHIKLLPTGGEGLKTLPDFMKAGADAVGLGSRFFRAKRAGPVTGPRWKRHARGWRQPA